MAIILSRVSERVFDILKGYGVTLYLFDDEGSRVYDYKKATRFFAEPLNLMIMIDDEDRGIFKVFISSGMDINKNRKLIDSLKRTAGYFNMDYTIRQYGKELTVKDFAHINESALYGTSKSSYQKIGEVKLIHRHSDKIDEEKRGSRTRKIREAFLEDNQGQRFKLPTTWVNGNRSICRFVAEGGDFYSDTGITLRSLTEEYVGLKVLFKKIKGISEQTNYTKNLMVNTWERLHEINSIVHKLTSKTLYEEAIQQINEQKLNILNEQDISSRVEFMYESLGLDSGDERMKKIVETALASGLDEARKKKTVDFEVTPEIEAWAKFIKKMDAYSGDNIDRSLGDEGEEISDVDFLHQAKRLANKEIKPFPGAKATTGLPNISRDPEVANNQKKYHFYSTVAQKLNPVDDSIIGNIISRMADHYEYLMNDSVPVMSEKSGIFKSIEKLADAVAKMIGVDKSQYESIMASSIDSLTEWFKKFDVDTLINEEKNKKIAEKKNLIKKKIKEITEAKRAKAKALVEDQEKFFALATKVAHLNENADKVKKLTKLLSESQKRRLLRVVESTWDKPVVRNVAHAMELSEAYSWASVNLDANLSRMENFNQELGAYANKIAKAIDSWDMDLESKKGLGNVLSHLASTAKDPDQNQDPEHKMDVALGSIAYDSSNENVKKVIAGLKKIAYKLHSLHSTDDEFGESLHEEGIPKPAYPKLVKQAIILFNRQLGVHGSEDKAYREVAEMMTDDKTREYEIMFFNTPPSVKDSFRNPETIKSIVKKYGIIPDAVPESVKTKKNPITESKDGRKATSAMGSSDRMADRMDKIGSPRQFALDKARGFVAKGMDPKEALERVNVAINRENMDYVRGGLEMKKAAAGDKYAAMARKYGIKESTELTENYVIYSGSVRNKDMFIEAIAEEKGHSIAEATKLVLDQQPLQMVDKDILENIRDYAKIKNELDLAEAIQSYLENPMSLQKTTEEENFVEEGQKIKVTVEGIFEGLTGLILEDTGDFIKAKLDDVIDPQLFHKTEIVRLS